MLEYCVTLTSSQAIDKLQESIRTMVQATHNQSIALDSLREGQPVVFPTDTLYGMGVSVRDAQSPEVLYQIKRREKRKPVAWLVSGIDDLTTYGKCVPELAQALARTFWPGPLTIIVRASDAVPEQFRSPEGTIGMRMPSNPEALAMIEALGCPIATTSANFSGVKPPRAFSDIDPELAAQISVLLEDDDMANPKSGIASTIVDCTTGHAVMKRVGAITIEDIKALS